MNKLAPRGTTTAVPPGVVLRPVVALDLDGTLFNWHDDFLEFAWKWLHGRNKVPSPEWFMYRGDPLNHHLQISKEQYRMVKLAYRQSGLKRDLPAFPGAHDLVWAVRNAGAEVWVCTTRPYLRLDNIDPDTQELLERNQIEVDGVIFGDRKYCDLQQLVGTERVVGVLEDLPEQLFQAQNWGFNGMLIERHYNQEWWKRNGVMAEKGFGLPSLPHLPAAQEWLLAEIKDWMESHNVR